MKSGGGSGDAPVPLRLEVCVPTESTTVTVADCVPLIVGAKPTLKTHDAPAASELPQPLEAIGNAAPLVPVTVIEEIASEAVPEFESEMCIRDRFEVAGAFSASPTKFAVTVYVPGVLKDNVIAASGPFMVPVGPGTPFNVEVSVVVALIDPSVFDKVTL